MNITRRNIDELLDKGVLQCHMRSGNWWNIRRRGRTKIWKKDGMRIRIPFKMWLYGYGSITEADFLPDGTLRTDYYRVKEDA